MSTEQVQRIPPEAVRRPSRKTALMLPQPAAWARRGLVATAVGGVLALAALLAPDTSNLVKGCAAGGFFVLAGVAASLGLGRRLPLQNVGAAFLVLWAIAFVGATLGVKSSLFFGALVYEPDFGPRLLGIVPWQMPFLLLALAIASRETARLLLRPWRRIKNYGFWLLATGSLLVLLSDLALQPFALHAAHWWHWRDPVGAANFDGVPWIVHLSTLILVAVMLSFVGPWLIAKRPVANPPDFQAVILWVSLTWFFVVGDLLQRRWLPVGVSVVATIAVLGWAWRIRVTASEPAPAANAPVA